MALSLHASFHLFVVIISLSLFRYHNNNKCGVDTAAAYKNNNNRGADTDLLLLFFMVMKFIFV